MDLWNKIRMQVERQGVSIREIQRQTGSPSRILQSE